MKRYEENKTPNIIRYNWELLKKYTKNNPRKMLEFFDNVYVRKTENYFYLNEWATRIVAESKSNSPNYILNVKELIQASNYATDSEVFIYLDLASKRNYFTFANTKGKAIHIQKWKIAGEYDVKALEMNRLLTFDDENIYLLYEIGE
jgi:hypothetical protein